MLTASLAIPSASTTSTNRIGRTLNIVLAEIRYELVRALRTRAFSLSAIGFPLMFYCLFGLLMNRGEDLDGVLVAKYLLGGYAVFGSLGAAIFGVGVGVALDIHAGWLELKRASPMPPLAYIVSKCATAIAFSIIIVCLLSGLGVAFGHVHLSGAELARMLALAAFGSVPFCALGLVMAFLVPPNSAGGIANLIYLPMSFFGGLWIPITMLPHAVRLIAPALPTFHLAQLMYACFGATPKGAITGHLVNLLGFTSLMLGIAWIAFSRREQNS
ncbi:MAG TPA: ABC transporter permease [Acidobacteriaceae bacterium]|nr:ABC transporter permease [Acidobacteriaceae bacterium]